MRYWNSVCKTKSRWKILRLYPAYEVLKPDEEALMSKEDKGLYPAYEVLKLSCLMYSLPNKSFKFVSRLWGIETKCCTTAKKIARSLYPAYEVLKRFLDTDVKKRYAEGLYPAYEVLKLLITGKL